MEKEKKTNRIFDFFVKNGYLILGVFVVQFVVSALLFIFYYDSSQTPDLNLNLEGTWKIVVYVNNNTVTLPNSEYIEFHGDRASSYNDSESDPYITSSFDLTTDSARTKQTLALVDIDRSYTFVAITENYIRLYENNYIYRDLIRYANNDRTDLDYDTSLIYGKWNVVYRNTAEIISTEQLEFLDGELRDYRNGQSTPSATSTYFWDASNHLFADTWGMEMACYPMNQNTVFFVETTTGYVWELSREE